MAVWFSCSRYFSGKQVASKRTQPQHVHALMWPCASSLPKHIPELGIPP